MNNPNAGLLERSGIHVTADDGQNLKKLAEAQKALLDSIGTVSAARPGLSEDARQRYAERR